MTHPPAPSYMSITDLLVALEDNRLRFKVLENPVHWQIVWQIEKLAIAGRLGDVSGIAMATKHSRNTVAKRIQELVEMGYLEYVADPKDSRRNAIAPTIELRQELGKYSASVAPAIARASFLIQREFAEIHNPNNN